MVAAIVFFLGCQAKPVPLSAGAQAFKKEVKACLDKLSVDLVAPITKRDLNGIKSTLQQIEPQAVKLCRMCPFSIGVLNRYGETMAIYPPREITSNFSNYELVTKTVNTKKIQQQRFYLQDGAILYIICAPIIGADQVIGLAAIAINAEEAKQRWGITEKEFLALNFNT
ncbi:MAG: hypothetical protein WC443_02840 [Desulfobaccales bacterium]